MRWVDHYDQKLMTADDAVRLVRSGDRVYLHEGCGTPEPLIEALLRRAPHLHDVEIVHMLTFGNAGYTRPEYEGIFRHNGLFLGANTRTAVQEGRADYTPIFLSEIEGLFTSGEMPLDVAIIQTSPPDSHGYLSLGTSVDTGLTAAKCAKHVIVEVNRQMPRTFGDTFIHVSQVSALVETDRPLLELHVEPACAVKERIAERVAALIPDGATLQTGIGGIPDAVLRFVRDRRDLGVHSEMISDGVIDLVECGALTGKRKRLHPGKIVAGFVLATKRLFQFMHENPIFEMHPTSYVNDPFVIAQNDNVIAINSAIEVDLSGQVCADSIGNKPYSGFGGQVDFVRGAARSKGGRPIIALQSTAKNGTISRIVPSLKPGSLVVTSRADVHYVVTEHGTAYLHGKTLRQRAEALIAVADPRFRDELYEAAVNARVIAPKGVLVG